MSHTYNAGFVADAQTREEFARLQQALNDGQPEMRLKVLYAAPKRLFSGMVVYADGTTWDPGSGEGVYVRNAANNAWRHLG